MVLSTEAENYCEDLFQKRVCELEQERRKEQERALHGFNCREDAERRTGYNGFIRPEINFIIQVGKARAEALRQVLEYSDEELNDEVIDWVVKQASDVMNTRVAAFVSAEWEELTNRAWRSHQDDSHVDLQISQLRVTGQQAVTAAAQDIRGDLRLSMFAKKKARSSVASTGAVVYNLNGTHARVNIDTADYSVNISNVTGDQLFALMRQTIHEQVSETAKRVEILERLDTLEKTCGSPSFTESYKEFIATVANHITILAPFLPALAQMLK